jgi:hypothetical protein
VESRHGSVIDTGSGYDSFISLEGVTDQDLPPASKGFLTLSMPLRSTRQENPKVPISRS